MALAHSFSLNNKVYIFSRKKLDLINKVGFENVKQRSYEEFSQLFANSNNPLCIIAIASMFLRSFLESRNFKEKNMKVLCASKGIEYEGCFMNEILEIYFKKENLAFLAGPSFASEVRKNLPCALVVHSENKNLSYEFMEIFPKFVKTYAENDVIGAEIAGAYKNVIAIASGINDGLNLGNNSKASLLSRGLVEMARFGSFFGAKESTFLGLSGSGDLFLTSNSIMSRNYRVGLGLAKNESLEDILNNLGEVAEGVISSKAIYKLALKHNIYTPIVREIQNIFMGKKVKDSLKDLLSKNQK